MAGRGGTRGKPARGIGRTNACATLSFDTLLQSPEIEVLKRLKIGDVLNLKIVKVGNYDTIVAVFKGDVAGTIMSQDATSLLGCMHEGHDYVATVKELKVPACKVSISHT